MKRLLAPIAAALVLAGCSAVDEPAKAPSPREANRAAITDFASMLTQQGKPSEAFAKYFAPDIIQHDPWIGDGNQGDEEFLEARKEAAPGKFDDTEKYVNVIHTIMADEQYVAIKSHVFTSPADQGREFVDIWRVENGKFAEHWDVIMPIEPEAVASRTLGCGVGLTYALARQAGNTVERPACGKPDPSGDPQANTRLVLDYMKMGLEPGRRTEAIRKYVAEDLRQHSARIPQGRQGLIEYMEAREAQRLADNRRNVFARTVADGDMVMVHRWVSSDSDPRGKAFIDLFRVKNGKVTDHWDLFQDVPPFSVSGRSMVIDGPLEKGRSKGPAPLE